MLTPPCGRYTLSAMRRTTTFCLAESRLYLSVSCFCCEGRPCSKVPGAHWTCIDKTPSDDGLRSGVCHGDGGVPTFSLPTSSSTMSLYTIHSMTSAWPNGPVWRWRESNPIAVVIAEQCDAINARSVDLFLNCPPSKVRNGRDITLSNVGLPSLPSQKARNGGMSAAKSLPASWRQCSIKIFAASSRWITTLNNNWLQCATTSLSFSLACHHAQKHRQTSSAMAAASQIIRSKANTEVAVITPATTMMILIFVNIRCVLAVSCAL